MIGQLNTDVISLLEAPPICHVFDMKLKFFFTYANFVNGAVISMITTNIFKNHYKPAV